MNDLRRAFRLAHLATLAITAWLVAGPASVAATQDPGGATDDATPAPARLAIAVPAVEALPAVLAKAEGHGQGVELAQIVEGLDAKLADALQNTRKFEVRAHVELARILGEQQAQDSGNYDLTDPSRARPFRLAGIPYLAFVQIDDFQDQVQTAAFDAIGQKATRRQIRLGAVCRVFDATRGTLLESARITLTDFDFRNNPRYVVDQKGGDLTEAVVNAIADRMADRLAQRIVDVIFPAKVLVVRDGFVTFNRGEGAGVSVGEIWEVLAPGDALVDPDTGENLGSEEVPVGLVRVVSTAPKFARAEICGLDRGIARQCILRRTARSDCGLEGAPRMYAPVRAQDSAPPLREVVRPTPPVGRVEPAEPLVEPDASRTLPTAAIFVRNREPRIDDARVMTLEDYVVAELDGACFTTLSREDVANAVSRFAQAGPNAGTGSIDPSKDLDRILSDSTSALGLAQSMGADYLLVASIAAISTDRRRLTDPARGVESDVAIWRLDATYRILGRSEGGVIAAGAASATESIRQSPGLAVERDVVVEMLRESARRMAAALKDRCGRSGLPAAEVLVRVPLRIDAASSEIAVPEIVRDDEGRWTIAPGGFRVAATDFVVEIDGILVGATPAPIEAVRGLRKLRVSRPDYEPFEATVNVQPGIGPILVPMRPTEAGLARIADMTAFFDGLERGRRLNEAEAAVLEGFADFFRNSRHSVEQKTDVKVETDEAPVFSGNSFWNGVPWAR